MIRRVLLVLLGAVALVLALATPAAAHASLESTDPAGDAVLDEPTSAVELRFTEPVDAGLGGIKVFGPSGDRVDDGGLDTAEGGAVLRAAVDAEARGTYTVAWSVTSEDGHLIAGSFLFSVGEASEPTAITDAGRTGVRVLAGVARWVAFAGTMALVGALAFDIAVRRRAAATPATARLALGGALATAAASAILLVTYAALAADTALGSSVTLVDDVVADTRVGLLGAVRILFALSAAVLSAVRRRRVAPRAARALTGALVLPALGLLAVPALAGHAWTASPANLAVGADVMHLAAASVWAGGLGALLLHLRDADGEGLTRRFSTLALAMVGVVVLTGSVSSYLQVRTLEGLETDYGRLLAVKVVVVLTVIGVASLTRSLLKQEHEHRSVTRLVVTELGIVLVVLGVTATLVNQPPARSAIVVPVNETVAMDGAIPTVQVQVQPGGVGMNDIHLYFIGDDGLPTPVDAVELTVGRDDVPPRRVEITPVTPDHVSAYRVNLPTPGRWSLVITAVRVGSTSTATVEVEIR